MRPPIVTCEVRTFIRAACAAANQDWGMDDINKLLADAPDRDSLEPIPDHDPDLDRDNLGDELDVTDVPAEVTRQTHAWAEAAFWVTEPIGSMVSARILFCVSVEPISVQLGRNARS